MKRTLLFLFSLLTVVFGSYAANGDITSVAVDGQSTDLAEPKDLTILMQMDGVMAMQFGYLGSYTPNSVQISNGSSTYTGTLSYSGMASPNAKLKLTFNEAITEGGNYTVTFPAGTIVVNGTPNTEYVATDLFSVVGDDFEVTYFNDAYMQPETKTDNNVYNSLNKIVAYFPEAYETETPQSDRPVINGGDKSKIDLILNGDTSNPIHPTYSYGYNTRPVGQVEMEFSNLEDGEYELIANPGAFTIGGFPSEETYTYKFTLDSNAKTYFSYSSTEPESGSGARVQPGSVINVTFGSRLDLNTITDENRPYILTSDNSDDKIYIQNCEVSGSNDLKVLSLTIPESFDSYGDFEVIIPEDLVCTLDNVFNREPNNVNSEITLNYELWKNFFNTRTFVPSVEEGVLALPKEIVVEFPTAAGREVTVVDASKVKINDSSVEAEGGVGQITITYSEEPEAVNDRYVVTIEEGALSVSGLTNEEAIEPGTYRIAPDYFAKNEITWTPAEGYVTSMGRTQLVFKLASSNSKQISVVNADGIKVNGKKLDNVTQYMMPTSDPGTVIFYESAFTSTDAEPVYEIEIEPNTHKIDGVVNGDAIQAEYKVYTNYFTNQSVTPAAGTYMDNVWAANKKDIVITFPEAVKLDEEGMLAAVAGKEITVNDVAVTPVFGEGTVTIPFASLPAVELDENGTFKYTVNIPADALTVKDHENVYGGISYTYTIEKNRWFGTTYEPTPGQVETVLEGNRFAVVAPEGSEIVILDEYAAGAVTVRASNNEDVTVSELKIDETRKNVAYVTLDKEYTEPGKYTVYIMEGCMTIDGKENPEFSPAYTIVSIINYEENGVAPESGSSILLPQTVTVTYPVQMEATTPAEFIVNGVIGQATLSGDDYNVEIPVTISESGNALEMIISDVTIPAGAYKLTIPGQIAQSKDAENSGMNDEIVLDYTILENYFKTVSFSAAGQKGNEVEALKEVTVTFANAGDNDVKINDGFRASVKAAGSETSSSVTAAAEGNKIVLTMNVTEAGTYTVTLPKGMVTIDGQTNEKEEYTATYTVVPAVFEGYEISPDPSSLRKSLESVTLTFPVEVQRVSTVPVTVSVSETEDGESADISVTSSVNGNVVTLTFSPSIETYGTYTLSIPQGAFIAKSTAEGRLHTGNQAIEAVYSIQGDRPLDLGYKIEIREARTADTTGEWKDWSDPAQREDITGVLQRIFYYPVLMEGDKAEEVNGVQKATLSDGTNTYTADRPATYRIDETTGAFMPEFEFNISAAGSYTLTIPGGQWTVNGLPVAGAVIENFVNIVDTNDYFTNSTTTPADESVVESISTIDLRFFNLGTRKPVIDQAAAKGIKLGETAATEVELTSDNKLIMTWTPAITTEGEYTLVIPENVVTINGNSNQELTFKYDIYKYFKNAEFTAPDPTTEEFESVSEFEVTFPALVGRDVAVAVADNINDKISVEPVKGGNIVHPSDASFADGVLKFSTAPFIIGGEYTAKVSADVLTCDGQSNAEVKVNFTIVQTDFPEEVMAPADGQEVRELTEVTVTFDAPEGVEVRRTSNNNLSVTVNGEPAESVLENNVLTVSCGVTEFGEVEVKVPAGMFTVGAGASENAAFSAKYTVIPEFMADPTLKPRSGATIEDLNDFVIDFNDLTDGLAPLTEEQVRKITVTVDGVVYYGYFSEAEGEGTEFVEGSGNSEVDVRFADADGNPVDLYTEGTYYVVIPEGVFVDARTASYGLQTVNKEVRANYTVKALPYYFQNSQWTPAKGKVTGHLGNITVSFPNRGEFDLELNEQDAEGNDLIVTVNGTPVEVAVTDNRLVIMTDENVPGDYVVSIPEGLLTIHSVVNNAVEVIYTLEKEDYFKGAALADPDGEVDQAWYFYIDFPNKKDFEVEFIGTPDQITVKPANGASVKAVDCTITEEGQLLFWTAEAITAAGEYTVTISANTLSIDDLKNKTAITGKFTVSTKYDTAFWDEVEIDPADGEEVRMISDVEFYFAEGVTRAETAKAVLRNVTIGTETEGTFTATPYSTRLSFPETDEAGEYTLTIAAGSFVEADGTVSPEHVLNYTLKPLTKEEFWAVTWTPASGSTVDEIFKIEAKFENAVSSILIGDNDEFTVKNETTGTTYTGYAMDYNYEFDCFQLMDKATEAGEYVITLPAGIL